MIDTGGPAFPTMDSTGDSSDDDGMTLLDHFAGLAMKAEIVSMTDDLSRTIDIGLKSGEPTKVRDYIALAAYSYARAMLAERKRLMEEK